MDRDDVDRERAVAVLDTEEAAVCSDHVLVETWRLLARWVGWHVADRAWSVMLHGDVHVEIVGRGDLERALTPARHSEASSSHWSIAHPSS